MSVNTDIAISHVYVSLSATRRLRIVQNVTTTTILNGLSLVEDHFK